MKQYIKLCLFELEDLVECTGEPDEMFGSHFNKFLFNGDNDGNWTLSASLATCCEIWKTGKLFRSSLKKKGDKWKKDLANRLIETMWERIQSFENSLFEYMS